MANTKISQLPDASLPLSGTEQIPVVQTGVTVKTTVADMYAGSDAASFVGYQPAGTGAVATTVQAKLRESVSVKDFGAVGNATGVSGVGTDDTAAFTSCFAAVPAYGEIDLVGGTYRITGSIPRPAVGVTVRNGRVFLDNSASNQIYAMVANDYCIFDGVYFLGTGSVGTAGTPKYQGGVFSGNTTYASPMNTTPANYVTVRNCTFDSLTVGVFAGGSSGDPVPTGWRIEGNAFINIVGYAGQSEGYGALFTPANNGIISGNVFKTIRRHAIYLASEASNNVIDGNVIDGCDNIAIQSNTSVTQNYADGNVITNNTIKGLTRSIAYGYRSSIGIGLYGKHSNCLVANNRIYGALDTGIDTGGELSGTAYNDRVAILNNHIVMDATATDTGIRLQELLSGKVQGNYISLQNSIYGAVVTSGVTPSTAVIDIGENTFDTTVASAVCFRLALSSARVVRIFRNTLNGFTNAYANRILDTSSAGTRRTDLNSNAGYYGTDADFTHIANGTAANTDCRSIRHAATLTAARQVVLTNPSGEVGAEVTIMRTGGGAFNLNIYDGGVIKALTTGQWGRYVWNGAGWEQAAFGSM